MSFLAVMFKVIPYILPFLKEMLIGRKSWRQAFKDNRGKTILAFVVIVSVTFNIMLTAKVGTLAYQYLEMSRAKQELELKYQLLEKTKVPVEGSAKHPMANSAEVVVDVKKEIKVEPLPRLTHVDKVKPRVADEVNAEFERMRQREAAAEH